MSTTDHMPLPLGHKIPHVSALPLGTYPLARAQALERIAQGALGLQVRADFLGAEAFRMRTEQRHNALTHRAQRPASPARRWLLSTRLCISNVTVRISNIIFCISNVTEYIGNRQAKRL